MILCANPRMQYLAHKNYHVKEVPLMANAGKQLKQKELLETVKETDLTPVREFVPDDRPNIKGAPEHCENRGLLLKKEAAPRLYLMKT